MMMKEKPKKKKNRDYGYKTDCNEGNQEGDLVDGMHEVIQPSALVKDIYEFT